jgi:hypothetical protein
MAMRILLQQKETGLYLKDLESWSHNPAEATDFISSTKAMDFCAANKISGVQLVLKFEDQAYDIVMQMAADQRLHGEHRRPAA